MSNQQTSLFDRQLIGDALKESFIKLKPQIMWKNPVMFTVEIGTAVMLIVCLFILFGVSDQGGFGYNITIFLILFATLLFCQFCRSSC